MTQTSQSRQNPALAEHPHYRRTLRVLMLAQLIAGAGLGAGVTVGGLLAVEMIGSTSAAGYPAALFTLGGAFTAVVVGQVSSSRGRRVGLSLGYAAGALGALLVVVAAMLDSVVLLLPALAIYGAGNATGLQARYGAADLAGTHNKGKALSMVLLATTAGAVLGPNLAGISGTIAETFGIPHLSGLFAIAVIAYGLGALVVVTLLKPDPLLLAKADALSAKPTVDSCSQASPTVSAQTHNLLIAALIMGLTQLVMVAIMSMTPIHMRHHGHSVTAIGVVISLHIAAMFLPSPLSGSLVDRFGAKRIGLFGMGLMVVSGILAAVVPANNLPLVTLTLILLGLGWSLGLVAGSTLVTTSSTVNNRAKLQGRMDLLVAASSAAAALSSGPIVSHSGFATLGLTCSALTLTACLVLVFHSRRQIS